MAQITVHPKLVDSGRLVTKSIVIPSQGFYGGGSDMLGPYRIWRSDLI